MLSRRPLKPVSPRAFRRLCSSCYLRFRSVPGVWRYGSEKQILAASSRVPQMPSVCCYYQSTVVLQVNETLLRSIVTQPPRENYVYARGFDTLDLVRNLVLGKACNVLVTLGTATTTTTTTTLPTPSITPTTTAIDRGGLKTVPSFDGILFKTHFSHLFHVFMFTLNI